MATSSLLRIVLIAAVIVVVIVRRLRGEPVQARRLLMLPAVLTVVGVVDLVRGIGHLLPADIVLLLLSAVAALGLGAARGATIQVFAREGHPWQRYRPMTLVVWAVLVAARGGLGVIAHDVGAPSAAGTTSLLLVLGLSLLAESAVVAPRAQALGLPLAAGPGRRTMR